MGNEYPLALEVELNPIDVLLKISPLLVLFIKKRLVNNRVAINEKVFVSIGINRKIVFMVTKIIPNKVCIIDQDTNLLIINNGYQESEYINIEAKIVVCPKCKTFTVPEATTGNYPPEIVYVCQRCKSIFIAITKIELFKDHL